MWNDILNYITANWLYFVIGGAILLLLLVVIIVASVKHKKKKAKLKDQEQLAEKEKTTAPTDNRDDKVNKVITLLSELLSEKNNTQASNDNMSALIGMITSSKEDFDVVKDYVEMLSPSIKDERLKILVEILKQKEKDQQEVINEIELDRQLLNEMNKPQQVDTPVEEPKQEPQTVVETKPVVVVTEKVEVKENDKELESESNDDDMQKVPMGAKIISGQRLELRDAVNALPDNQKKYFKKLELYADKKTGATKKERKYDVTVGVGNNPYIRLEVKRNTLIAYFRLENEENWDLRYRLGIKSAKVKETPVKITNDQEFETAIGLIDKREQQVESEKAFKRELQKEKRRKKKES